jgi:NAD(P)H-dependent flavin oxidoreductase YrpB (nitropropane dioxygenase family)
VLLGTRLLATEEAPVHPNYKKAIVQSTGHDTVLTEIPDIAAGIVWPGAMARALHNDFIGRWAGKEWALRQRAQEVSQAVQQARQEGDTANASLLIGQDAGLIDQILPAGEVVRQMVRQAHEIISARLPS